jgi:putative pyruvate formate lyase activating enzyme
MWRFQRPDAIAVLKDRLAKRSLARYFAAMQNQLPAKFLVAKKVPAEFNTKDSTQQLWREHLRLTQEFSRVQREIDDGQRDFHAVPTPEKSYLDLKIEIADRILSCCHLCARKCGVNRLEGESGYCKCGLEIAVSSIFEHVGEEPELVPSGTIFTLGCTMRCKHCQNWTISQWKEYGQVCEPADMAREVERLRVGGCRNVNLVGGEPTSWLQQWLRTFKYVGTSIPVVWNSNSYYSSESAALLAGFVDVYLLDFKYGPGRCAEEISDAPNYWETCTCNHLEAKKHGELIIRILVLPNHLECCAKPIIGWIAKNLGIKTRVNIMFQYRPEWKAFEVPELSRELTLDEMQRAIQLVREANLLNFIT